MDATTATVKICPQCQASFSCAPADCWCSKLPHIMPMDPHAACYCPRCLAAIIESKIAGEAKNRR